MLAFDCYVIGVALLINSLCTGGRQFANNNYGKYHHDYLNHNNHYRFGNKIHEWEY
jgi:hypothetical protein